jgi:hypothetical protein
MAPTLSPPEVTRAARLLGRRGGTAAARAMTPEERLARAKKASDAALAARTKNTRKETTDADLR